MRKRALITGITGQDGSYLAELLISKGYDVYGLVRRSSTFNRGRIEHIYTDPDKEGRLHLIYGDMADPFSLMWALKKSRPQEIYNLAAQSHVGVSWEVPLYTAQVTGLGVLNLLESVRVLGMEKKCRIYQASTSELYSGNAKQAPQNEDTPFDPQSPYASAKLYGFHICKNYRRAFGMFVANGILFNHESPRRGENFVTRKIVIGALKGVVRLGNINARRDWGFAGDYVDAMWRMLQTKTPQDLVIATGETHSVAEFVAEVRKHIPGFKVVIDERYKRPAEVEHLRGDAQKAKRVLSWRPTKKFQDLVKMMVEAEQENQAF